MRMDLTDSAVRGLRAGKTTDYYVRDTERQNLYIRVLKSGSKVWYLKMTVDGVRHLVPLGEWTATGPHVESKQARRLYDIEAGKIAGGGRQSLERRTLLFVANHWFSTKNHRHPEDTRRYIDRDLAPLLNRPIASIRTDVVKALFTSKLRGDLAKNIRPAPAAAEKLFIFTVGIFKHALKQGWLRENPLENAEVSDWGGQTQQPRNIALTHDEIRLVWNFALPHRTLYRLLLCTGQRLSEVQALARHPDQIKGDKWVIPKRKESDPRSTNKSNREHTVPVMPLMRSTLADPFIDKRRSAAWSYWVARLPIRPDGERVTQHDIRHTVASGMKELGVMPMVIEALLNHAEAFIYQSSADMQPQFRSALAKWHKKLLAIVAE